MTEKAPTDAELLSGYEIAEAWRARLTNAQSLVDNATRAGRSLAEVKRSDLARIVLALGGSPAGMSRTMMVMHIEMMMSA